MKIQHKKIIIIALITIIVPTLTMVPTAGDFFTSLPKELKIMILNSAMNGQTADELIQEAKKMRLISKDFKKEIDHILVNGSLIENIAVTYKHQKTKQDDRFRDYLFSIAKKFGSNPAAQAWAARKKLAIPLEGLLFKNIIEAGLDEAELMIRNGFPVNTLGVDGETPLMSAASYAGKNNNSDHSAKFVAFLLNYGANPNLTGMFTSATPLYYATMAAQPDIVKQLLKAGAKVDVIRNDNNETPLHNAVFNLVYNESRREKDIPNLLQITKILLEAGANPNTIRERGTMLDMAFRAKDPDYRVKEPQKLIDLLQQHGAKRARELP